MTTLHEVITMPDGSGVVTIRKDSKTGGYILPDEIYKAVGGDGHTVILTINRKEPLDGVPNVNSYHLLLYQLSKEHKDKTGGDADSFISGYIAAGGFTEEQVREAIQKAWYENYISKDEIINAIRRPPLPAQVEIVWDEFGKCDDCKNIGMMNCAHFDRCGATTEYRIKHLHGQPQVKLIYK